MVTAGTRRTWLVRALLVASILGAWAEVRLPSAGPALPPVPVVDVSASIGPGPLAPPAEARTAPTWFAVGASVREVEGRATAPAVSREATRLAAGIRQATARYPGRDLWVFTDGRGTDGDAAAAARAVAAGGGRVHVSAPVAPAADVALLSARAARSPAPAGVEVSVRLGASTSGRVRVVLAREGRSVDQEAVEVFPGLRQRVVLADPAAPAAAAAYTVRLVPEASTPDDDRQNNELAVGVAGDRPGVLVWGDLQWGGASPPELPFRVRHMAAWEGGALDAADCLVVTSLPWRRIGETRLGEILRFVAGGGRLLVLGGPRSWHAGGWGGSVLEEELLGLRVPRQEGDGLAVVLALDRSGSTAGRAIQALRAATQGLARALGPGERLAVLPFAAEPSPSLLAPGWLGSDAAPADREALATSLDALLPGGRTDLPRAIVAAAERAPASARARRVLLLTDGDPDHVPDAEALAPAGARLRALDVKFAALLWEAPAGSDAGGPAGGAGAPARRLKEALGRHVARRAEDVVLLADAGEVPPHLLQELDRARAEEEARRAAPDGIRHLARGAEGPDPYAALLRPSWLHVLEVAPTGRLVAEAFWDDAARSATPFAARRTVGAGEVLALAWGPETEAEPSRAAATLAPLLGRLAAEADRGLRVDVDGAWGTVLLPEARGTGSVVVVAGESEAPWVEIAPGRFRGRLDADPRSGLRVRLPASGGEETGRERPLRLPARPPPEHRGAGVDEAAMRALARAGQGLRLPAGQLPPRGRLPPGPSLSPWLLLLAAILLVLDRALGAQRGAASRPILVGEAEDG